MLNIIFKLIMHLCRRIVSKSGTELSPDHILILDKGYPVEFGRKTPLMGGGHKLWTVMYEYSGRKVFPPSLFSGKNN